MPGSTNTAQVRIEVLLDGHRIALAGVEEFGVVSAIVNWVRRHPEKISPKVRAQPDFDEAQMLREVCEVTVGGLDSLNEKHLHWAREGLRPGSEVIIRILPAGEFDPPKE